MGNLEIRGLLYSDLKAVQELDKSGEFYVAQWVEDLYEIDENGVICDSEPSDSAFGAFLNDELIGYCTLGYACGALDICNKQIGADDKLLSDVYIKPEYRRQGYGTDMVRHVLSMEEESVYLTFLYDELEDFYKPLGFYHIEGTDNIMERPDTKQFEFEEPELD